MMRVLPLRTAAAAAFLISLACSGSGKDEGPDTTPPSITITSPLADDVVTTATVPLRALVVDGGGVASVEFALDGGAPAPLPGGNGEYAVDVPLPLADGAPMSFTVHATDRAGNEASATRAFRVDRVAPVVAIAGEDAACADACTGAVVRAADGPYRLAGVATDGSGLGQVLVIVTDDLGAEVGSAEVPVDASGAFAWDWDPWADGRFFTLTVSADDPKGNSGSAARLVYVDRVSPTVTQGPASPAPLGGPLVAFSEPMAASSVAAATTLSLFGGAQVAAALAWTDDRSFGFAPPLEPFTQYQLEIGAGATDRAGNPLAPYGAWFETEMIPPPAGPSVVASGARRPRIAVLGDGRPVVVYGTAGAPRAVWWDGRGAWADQEISNAALAGGVAVDLSAQRPLVEALFSVPNGGADDLFYARSVDLASWIGWSDGPEELVASAVSADWPAAFGVQCLLPLDCLTTALFGDAQGARYSSRDPAGWSAPNLVKATGPGARGARNAFVDDRVYYLDTRLGPPRSPPFYVAVTNAVAGVGWVVGAEAARPLDPFYQANPFVAFTAARAGADPAADDLHLACSSATPWLEAVVSLATTVEELDLAVSSAKVVVAAALADGTVLFGSAPNGELLCLVPPPAPAWEPAVPDAAEPAVALGGADGTTLWKAWVRASSGELFVGR